MRIKYTPVATIFLAISFVIFFYYYQQALPIFPATTTTFSTTTSTKITTTTIYSYDPKCNQDNECGWEAANCCTENSGAKWECVKKGKFFETCSKIVALCPQFLSPKPTNPCACINNECATE